GDCLTPYYNYEPRFQKPILYYWVTAATFAVTGPGEASARLWAALSAFVASAVLVLRTAWEDRLLQRELPGYSAYAARTRWRLLPGVW
ncbi:MAG TPA: hypothetical protein PKC32_00510, partial [Sphingopyxis sp.]|nr:hypothetical protein [Sphingopyxis sp.]